MPSIVRGLRAGMDRVAPRSYWLFSGLIVGTWLACWLVAFVYAYGWHIDDTTEFRTVIEPMTPQTWFNPPWLHAYTWLITPIPIFLHNVLHLAVPSLPQGQTWSAQETGYYRLVMLYTLLVQAAILVLIALFMYRLVPSARYALFALTFFCLSPPLNWWAATVDNRLLGLSAAIPAMWMLTDLLRSRGTGRRPLTMALAAGFLIGIGQGIHYTCLYLVLPWSLLVWGIFLARSPRKQTLTLIAAFGAGIALYFVFCEAGYHLVPLPARQDPIKWMLAQNGAHIAGFSLSVKLTAWLDMLVSLLGIPAMIATAAGAAICLIERLRPAWLDPEVGLLLAGTSIVGMVYLFITPAIGFYRQTSCLQFVFGLLCAIAVFSIRLRLPRMGMLTLQALLLAVVLAVPAIHSRENLRAAQGLGKALTLAYRSTHGQVYYFEIITPAASQAWWRDVLKPEDRVVTMMAPIDPAMLGILHDTRPLGSFLGQLCTAEGFPEGEGLNNFRHWEKEPESCEARVYAGEDILRELNAPPLRIRTAKADSTLTPGFGPDRTVILAPRLGVSTGWVSNNETGEHYVELTLDCPEQLDALTVVAPDYFGFGDRIDNLSVSGSPDLSAPFKPLWAAAGLRDSAVFTAQWPAQRLARVRLTLVKLPNRHPWFTRPGYPENALGIAKILVPHRRLLLDPAGRALHACPP